MGSLSGVSEWRRPAQVCESNFHHKSCKWYYGDPAKRSLTEERTRDEDDKFGLVARELDMLVINGTNDLAGVKERLSKDHATSRNNPVEAM